MQYSRFFLFFLCLTWLVSCKQVPVTEKAVNIPRHTWYKNQPVRFRIEVRDSAEYDLFFIFRHGQKYPYTHILTHLKVLDSVGNPLAILYLNAPLIKADGSWAGDKMEDLYDHRMPVNHPLVLKPGSYRFILRSDMNDDPLPYVLNAGIGLVPRKRDSDAP